MSTEDDGYAVHARIERRLILNPRLHQNPVELRMNSLRVETPCDVNQVARLECPVPRDAPHTVVTVVTGTGKRYKAVLRTQTIRKAQEAIENSGGFVKITLLARLDGGTHLMDAGLDVAPYVPTENG